MNNQTEIKTGKYYIINSSSIWKTDLNVKIKLQTEKAYLITDIKCFNSNWVLSERFIPKSSVKKILLSESLNHRDFKNKTYLLNPKEEIFLNMFEKGFLTEENLLKEIPILKTEIKPIVEIK